MALKKSEKQLIGIMLFIAAGAAGFMWGMPNFAAIQQTWTHKSQLELQLKNNASAVASMQAEVDSLQQQMKLPNDIIIRKHTPDNLQANVKDILNKVMGIASRNDNTIISLAPWKEVPPILPPAAMAAPAAPAAAGTAAPAADAAAAPDPNAPPPPPAVPPLTVVGYELSIRGSFGSIQGFLKEMDSQKELVELSSLQIINEQGADRGAGTAKATGEDDKSANAASDGPIIDPNKPIKLIVKLRLVLEPETASATPAPAAAQ